MSERTSIRLADRPATPLRPFMHRYTSHRYEGFPSGVHQGLPSRHLTLMISLADPFRITAIPGPQAPGSFQAFVGGLHTSPATVAHDGRGCGIGVEVTPLGARRLLGMPAATLASAVVDLRDLWGGSVDQLGERLIAAGDWASRVGVLDSILSRLLIDEGDVSPEVAYVWHRLLSSGGMARIAALAAEVGWSRRHLSARFNGEYGLTPKHAARVMRFERASTALAAGRRPAEVAVTCGYVDQPHLNEEWRALTGMTPVQWLQDELRDLPDSL